MPREEGRIRINSIIYDDEKMEACMKHVGQRIRQERMQQNLSISGLADLSNLSTGCISKLESAQSRASLRALIKIAAALHKPVSFFIEQERGNASSGTEVNGSAALTNGERFEQITEEAEEDTVDFMLHMADGIMQMMKKK